MILHVDGEADMFTVFSRLSGSYAGLEYRDAHCEHSADAIE